MTIKDYPTLEAAKKWAACNGLDVAKVEQLFKQIETDIRTQKNISEIYQKILFWVSTGNVDDKDIAEACHWSSPKNVKSNVNKNLTDHLKTYFGRTESLGIKDLRIFLYQQGYFLEIDDDSLTYILPNRLTENLIVEETKKNEENLGDGGIQ